MTTNTAFLCPSCAGRWTGNFTFDHAAACRIGQADHVRVRADVDTLTRTTYGVPFEREATESELEILGKTFSRVFTDPASFHGPGVPAEVGIPALTSVGMLEGQHCRKVNRFDPDTITGPAATS